jgi:hypothetical protein
LIPGSDWLSAISDRLSAISYQLSWYVEYYQITTRRKDILH